ncbi:hypothetical protein LTR53_015268, partial [Teratosphaeriaceae sp. CCFEE 6253]
AVDAEQAVDGDGKKKDESVLDLDKAETWWNMWYSVLYFLRLKEKSAEVLAKEKAAEEEKKAKEAEDEQKRADANQDGVIFSFAITQYRPGATKYDNAAISDSSSDSQDQKKALETDRSQTASEASSDDVVVVGRDEI